MSANFDRKEPGGLDILTGLYSYAMARDELDRLFSRGNDMMYACIVFRLKNIRAMDREYGRTFTGAIIENTAKYLKHQYIERNYKSIICRLSRDTFLVVEFGRRGDEAVDVARWVCGELQKGYFGRHSSISTGVLAGICCKDKDDNDYRSGIINAGKAMELARKNETHIEVYDSRKEDVYGTLSGTYFDIAPTEYDERLYNYDGRFISFAVAMLSNAKDIHSSLDVLTQRIGWYGSFRSVLVCKFENDHFVRVISRFVQGVGVLVDDDEEIADMSDWDAFIRSFNNAGISIVDDTEAAYLTENDKEFFRARGIGSAINLLLYDDGIPSGYLSLCSSERNREWDKRTIDTFSQLSKIISVFLSLRIIHENTEKRINEMSTDFVTGLHIYAAFHTEAEALLNNYDDSKVYALAYTDVDSFSYINNNYGIDAGDKALKILAENIDKACRSGGLCAHLQGDKFVALFVRSSRKEIEETLRRLSKNTTVHYGSSGRKFRLSSSTGVYFIEKNDCSLKNALDCAIQVWKSVKHDGAVSYRIYDEEFKRKLKQRLDIISSYQQAIREGDITAFLQPKFSMRRWSAVGAEALCRWRTPNGAYKLPEEFIPALEENGQIMEVDFCVYEQILKALRRWKNEGKHIIPVSVNFSRLHLDSTDFVDRLKELAKRYDVDPEYIELEITESAVSTCTDTMLQTMRELREYGFKIEMDDFGTGYSSLAMLIEAPVDIVKVDKSFIDRYEDPVYRDYIDKIGGLITTARKDILFEGVETKEQMEFLTKCGYDTAQGYVFSRPIPMTEFEKNYIHDEE